MDQPIEEHRKEPLAQSTVEPIALIRLAQPQQLSGVRLTQPPEKPIDQRQPKPVARVRLAQPPGEPLAIVGTQQIACKFPLEARQPQPLACAVAIAQRL